MALKSIPASKPTVPAQVQLDKYDPNIYEVAEYMLNEIGNLGTLLEAIERAARNTDLDQTQTLIHVKKLARFGLEQAEMWENDHDCQIAACRLASDDQKIRAESRP